MTQDFAKRHKGDGSGKARKGAGSARTAGTHSGRSDLPGRRNWVWFFTGLVSGLFLAFLVYLGLIVPPDKLAGDLNQLPRAKPDQAVEEMRFDFYDLFPKSEVPIVEEYNAEGRRVESANPVTYLLQAGSFQNPDDANQLRAELILLGLTVFTREIKVDGNAWHRVMVGPLETELALNRAQDTLAEAEIESIPLKVQH